MQDTVFAGRALAARGLFISAWPCRDPIRSVGAHSGLRFFDDADAFYQRCLGQFFALPSEHVRQGSLNRETKPVADRFSPFECPLAAPGMVLLTFLVLGSLLWLNTVSGIFMQQAGVASGVYMKKGHRPQLFFRVKHEERG